MIVNYIQTEKLAVSTASGTESTLGNPDYDLTLAIVSGSPFHLRITPEGGAVEATSDDAYFPANTIHYFTLPGGGSFSIRGTSTTNVWASVVTIVSD
jgi:hypothetical protein